MARGDQIYVMRPLMGMDGVYEHHGIDCGDGTVIHYRKTDVATVARTSIASFANGQPIYVKRPAVAFIPDVVIERAESRLGEQTYNLVFNNCEHFANWCKTGRSESQQLANYGFTHAWLNTPDSQRVIASIAQETEPATAMGLFNQAMGNMAIARTRLQSQYNQAQTEANSWQRVAQVALQRGREDLARAALERKVQLKRKMADLQPQLEQLGALEASLNRNYSTLQQRLVT
ncbi:lecithin retinol acyltransferase family protein [Oculatella sp. LEGE 06141]|uniref:lecithin retinol acyltransferase family protein n=1 Tax=Oculatella sp. LEGE 06141 TaxID=1828648 RepID=UPI00187E12A5|nr:lecithin retinol acyltransferase family protein [Oculatella sp. LEGE 06141]MBE9178428.1 lecithin retinol acyltransferase family protein [Oculatella sp. LEGE 06141]